MPTKLTRAETAELLKSARDLYRQARRRAARRVPQFPQGREAEFVERDHRLAVYERGYADALTAVAKHLGHGKKRRYSRID